MRTQGTCIQPAVERMQSSLLMQKTQPNKNRHFECCETAGNLVHPLEIESASAQIGGSGGFQAIVVANYLLGQD